MILSEMVPAAFPEVASIACQIQVDNLLRG
jgi:hypothetical protein